MRPKRIPLLCVCLALAAAGVLPLAAGMPQAPGPEMRAQITDNLALQAAVARIAEADALYGQVRDRLPAVLATLPAEADGAKALRNKTASAMKDISRQLERAAEEADHRPDHAERRAERALKQLRDIQKRLGIQLDPGKEVRR